MFWYDPSRLTQGTDVNTNNHFEQSIEELENIVKQLEKGELPLESSLKQFEKGIQLAQKCQKMLTEAEQKIEILTSNSTIQPIEPLDE